LFFDFVKGLPVHFLNLLHILVWLRHNFNLTPYTTNQLERLAKEIKRRIKVIEVFPDEGSVERLLYLLLKELNERLNSRKLRGFKEIESGNYHALPGEFFTQ
jgi:transposase-like protein